MTELPMEDQLILIEALREAKEHWEIQANKHRDAGKPRVEKWRRQMAADAERLWRLLTEADTVLVPEADPNLSPPK